ncbi:MAG: ATP-binding protein [Nitrosomonas sp.]
METLELAELKGELKKKINQLLKFDVIIIDELGYDEQTGHAQPVSAHQCTVRIPFGDPDHQQSYQLGRVFIDDNVAVPIVDRIIHRSHIFMLGGKLST